MTFDDLRTDFDTLRLPDWRDGQKAFTMLQRSKPRLAETIRATFLDPFYDDSRLPAFWTYVAEHWDDA